MRHADDNASRYHEFVRDHYDELRANARSELRRESPSFSLESGDLVHCLYQRRPSTSWAVSLDPQSALRQLRLAMRNICRNRRRARASRRARQRTYEFEKRAGRSVEPMQIDQRLDSFSSLLTERQTRALQMYLRGNSNQVIASTLSVSARTVARDLRAAFSTLSEAGRTNARADHGSAP
ncbi:MAG: ECF-type sigma factor [Phycisphaerales bacterium]